jgi:hypothetical protein
MQLQDVGGEVMEVQDPPDNAMINGESVPGLDNAREFTRGEGVGKRQADDLLLDMDRYLGFEGPLPTLMRSPAVIQQALEAIPPKPLQIPPESLIGEARGVALLEEGTLPLQDGTEGLISG